MPRPVRRTQAISPFGVGAMVDFPGPVSLIHCGLDVWPFDENNPDHDEFKIEDETRLAARLGVEYFVLPPDFRYPQKGQTNSADGNFNLKLPFLRFPKWHVCPRCGLMYEAELHDRTAPECKGPIGSGKDKGKEHPPRRTVQVRFISACERGHIQDFPWWEWVSESAVVNVEGKRLRLVSSASASLAGVMIHLEDSKNNNVLISKSLSGVFDKKEDDLSAFSKIGVSCVGNNPALGIPSSHKKPKGCGEVLHPLLRNGSNVYFPRVVSSIYLPTFDNTYSEEILSIIDNSKVRTFVELISVTMDGEVNDKIAEQILKKFYPELQISPSELCEALNKHLCSKVTECVVKEKSNDEISFRNEEYKVLSNDINEGYPKTNLLIKSEKIDDYAGIISEFFERVSLVHKLRETRAFVGFSRIFPSDNLSDEERRSLFMEESKSWLPAIIVRGEGIFLKLKESKVLEWLEKNGGLLESRISRMQSLYDQMRDSTRQESRVVSPKFVLLHTLAHVLINQLVYDCGYGSASLRERLYCSEGKEGMSGILIYTAAGDSEGTMGGLVRMGKPGKLEPVVAKALESAAWCSSDPVCIESQGQGPDNCNLAACHACSLLPETSCEEGNRLLDRAMLIGTLDDNSLGFFSS